MNHFEQVTRFNEAARGELPHKPTPLSLDEVKLCLRLIFEESFEVAEACFAPESLVLIRMRAYKDAMQTVLKNEAAPHDLQQDNVDLLDGLCDTQVVCMGMAAMAGLPLNEGMDEVNASNLAKIDAATGLCIKDAGGKIQKPPGWKKPNLRAVIDWCFHHGNRGDVTYDQPTGVSVTVGDRLKDCGQFPDNLA